MASLESMRLKASGEAGKVGATSGSSGTPLPTPAAGTSSEPFTRFLRSHGTK